MASSQPGAWMREHGREDGGSASSRGASDSRRGAREIRSVLVEQHYLKSSVLVGEASGLAGDANTDVEPGSESTVQSMSSEHGSDENDPWRKDISIRSFREFLSVLEDPAQAAVKSPLPGFPMPREGSRVPPGRVLTPTEPEQLRADLAPFDQAAPEAIWAPSRMVLRNPRRFMGPKADAIAARRLRSVAAGVPRWER